MKYLLAGGGTAGHVNPLLALAELIKERESPAEITVLGTREGLESRLVPERGFELTTIAKLPFPRALNSYALRFVPAFIKAVFETAGLLKKRQIDAVVGFGGYAAAPAYAAAKIMRIPYIIHEANALPGIANKIGARGTPWVGVTFNGTPIPGAEHTGMPLRREITELNRAALRATAAEYFSLDPRRKTLLVTGGSLGAKAINEAVSAAAAELVAEDVQVLHVWGQSTELAAQDMPGYRVLPYCDRMDLAFSLADAVISRAGATAVSEISGLGIPAVFVPYRHGNGEQALNCRTVIEAGGALLRADDEVTAAWIVRELLPLLRDEQRLQCMSAAALSVGKLDGTERLYELVQRAVRAQQAV